MMNPGDIASSVLLILAVLAVIGLVFREVVCWYWKINRNVALLTDIESLLKPAGAKCAENTALLTEIRDLLRSSRETEGEVIKVEQQEEP